MCKKKGKKKKWILAFPGHSLFVNPLCISVALQESVLLLVHFRNIFTFNVSFFLKWCLIYVPYIVSCIIGVLLE